MPKVLNKIKEGIIDILFPKTCLGCGKEGAYICKGCEIFLSEVNMMEVGPPSSVSVWEYEGLMEKLIKKIKYDGCYDIVDELVEMAFKKMDLNIPKDTIITYVPMYKKKEKRRGFNQSELIAKKVSQLLRQAEQPLLRKIRDTPPQVGLGPQERAENVKGVFKMLEVGPSTSRPESVLVVDDVYTTGATMSECRKVLKKSGVKNVWGFTLSRKMSIQNC